MRSFLTRVVGLDKPYFQPQLNALKNLRLGKRRSLLVSGGNAEGLTSVLLEICSEYLEKNYTVLLFDFFDSCYDFRIPDFFDKDFYIIKPNGYEELMSLLHSSEFKDFVKGLNTEGVVFVYDSAYLLSESGNKVKGRLWSLRDTTFEFYPDAAVVMTERKSVWQKTLRSKEIAKGWLDFLIVRKTTLITNQREHIGHLIEITGRDWSSEAFVHYDRGRLSRPFDWGSAKDLRGYSSNIEYAGETVRGFWRLVKDTDALKRT